jgi:hypothetical protein
MIRYAVGLAVAAALLLAPAALASSTQSSNWAGYAIHKSGVQFKRVAGSWTQPAATCTSGRPTFSSVWVGIGGYNRKSNALEQIGTEADCSASGRPVSNAWYELVPTPSRTIRMTVNPGDLMRASVDVRGDEVRLQLTDLTRRKSFTRTIDDATLDRSSAEWIVEAPSECAGRFSCQALALADFGSATFSGARALTTTGHAGSIVNRQWVRTRITLATGGRRFIGSSGGAAGAVATPSALSAHGSSFTVSYSATTISGAAGPGPTMTVMSRPFLHIS